LATEDKIMEKNKNRRLMGVIHSSVWLILLVFAFGAVINIFEPKVALIYSIWNIGLVMVLFYAHLFFVNAFFEKKRYALFLLCSALLFFGIVGLRTFYNLQLMGKFDTPPVQTLVKPAFSVGLLVFLTSGFIWLLAIAYQLLMNRYEKERHNLQSINEQQKAQFQYLKAQINPHFLFNALNNIYSLTVVKSNDAPKMLLQLSDLLRYAIYDGQQELVPLEKEMIHIQKFIDIFQLQSENLLNITFEKPQNTEGVFVEPMILIPIVENCFKHCDFEQNEAAFTHIKCKIEHQIVTFTTANTFNESDTQKDRIGGVGLENIKRRLALRYGNDFRFETHVKDHVFTVFLSIKILKTV
jgi:two-component system, LytTR family, sensor kinase